jgi:hypothetical protein
MVVRLRKGKILAPEPYERFGQFVRALRAARHNVSILTFNYDIGVDLGLWLNHVDIDYCLAERNDPDNRSTELMKLHGSMSWAICGGCLQVFPRKMHDVVTDTERRWEPHMRDMQTKESIQMSRLQTFHTVKCFRYEQDTLADPMIVPPTASKLNLHQHLSSVWQRASQRLSEADNIFVIGYSWPTGDHFFHQLYALGTVGETILSRFWIFDPDERVRTKFRRRLLGEQALDCFDLPDDSSTFAHAVSMLPARLNISVTDVVPNRE